MLGDGMGGVKGWGWMLSLRGELYLGDIFPTKDCLLKNVSEFSKNGITGILYA